MVLMGFRSRWAMGLSRTEAQTASFLDHVLDLAVIAVFSAALYWSPHARPVSCSRRGNVISQLRGAVVFGCLWITVALMQLMAYGIPYPDGLGVGGTLLIALLGLVWPFTVALMALATVEISRDRRASQRGGPSLAQAPEAG